MAGFEGLAALCFNACARRLQYVPGSCIDARVHLKHHHSSRADLKQTPHIVGYFPGIVVHFFFLFLPLC